MIHSRIHYRRHDWLIAGFLTLLMLLLASVQLTSGMSSWGDDYAAYITEGIAISNGTFEEQTVKNYTLHPSELFEEASEKGIVYVWGYPLLLSLVHRFAGFDLEGYTSILLYKLPSVLCFSLMAGILYLFYRRRFSKELSLFLTLIFAASGDLFAGIEGLYVDVVFLFASMLSLWLAECHSQESVLSDRPFRTVFISLAYGAALWFTYETRLNGQTVVIVAAVSQLLYLVSNCKELRVKNIWLYALPYLAFIVLVVVSEALLLPATSNLSDVGDVSKAVIWANFKFYLDLVIRYLNDLNGPLNLHLWPIPLILLIIGFFSHGLRRQNIALTIFTLGTFVVLILLPYVQGLRYVFNILPILLMLAAYGGIHAAQTLSGKVSLRFGKSILAVLAAAVVVLAYADIIDSGISNLQNGRKGSQTDVYSTEAIELYRYIQDHTDEDDVIAFFKPRALYMNTGRMSFRPNMNGHVIEDADYFLLCKYAQYEFEELEGTILEKNASILKQVYENDQFSLHEVIK